MVSCGGRDTAADINENDDPKYPDGTYCADVTYHNPNTGTTSTYTLNVEVVNNELTQINWNNGGWLDDSHFNPPELSEDGYCMFWSDRGYEYNVHITGSECSITDVIPNKEVPKKKEPSFTLFQCATIAQMTEEELEIFENKFDINRADDVSEEMCNHVREYLISTRKLVQIEKENENGHIESNTYTSLHDEIACQLLLVKRRGMYYLLEARGPNKCPLGNMDFNPYTTDWQNVPVKDYSDNLSIQVFQMRVVESSISKSELENKKGEYCKFSF
jgi:hypothetical protein